MELKRIEKRAQPKLKNELRNKICACEDKRHSYRVKCEIASHDTQHCPYNNRKEQRWYIDRDRDHAYNHKRQAAKHPRVKRPGYRDRKDDHRGNQTKKLGHERPKSNGKVPCPIHSFPDKPVKHSWADCSKNPSNQRKQAPRSAVSAHHAAIDNCYLRNNNHSPMESDHTETVDNQSLDHHSLSNYNNNAFVTFKAPPSPACKKAAEKVKRNNKLVKNKRKTVSSSNNNGKAMTYTQPFAASAKGLDKPLAFSLEAN
jgi:hypothetical protein